MINMRPAGRYDFAVTLGARWTAEPLLEEPLFTPPVDPDTDPDTEFEDAPRQKIGRAHV